jgi:hypothetical protein
MITEKPGADPKLRPERTRPFSMTLFMACCLQQRLLPNNLNVVPPNLGISGDDRNAFDLSLSNKQAVERVAVQFRQCGDMQGVPEVNR